MTEKTKRLAVICDSRPLSPRTSSAAITQFSLRNHLGSHVADAGAGQADGARRALGEIKHASPDERAAVVHGDDDALAAMGHPQLGAVWLRVAVSFFFLLLSLF